MTNNEQWNAQLKKLSGDGQLDGVISNHCTVNQRDVELLEGVYRAVQLKKLSGDSPLEGCR
jgi:hypothetical protein